MEDQNQPQPVNTPPSNLPDLESVIQNARSEASQSTSVAQAPSLSQPAVQTPVGAPGSMAESALSSVPKAPNPWVRRVLMGAGIVMILGLIFLLYRTITYQSKNASQQGGVAENYNTQESPLRELSDELNGSSLRVVTDNSPQLTVNGRLNINGRAVIASSTRPTAPVAGELWYQQNDNKLYFYDGANYVDITYQTSVQGILQQLRAELRPTTLTAGSGLTINGTTISNNGVVGLTSNSAYVTVTDTGNGKYVISDNPGNSVVVLQQSTPGTAQTGNINLTGTVIAANFEGDGSGLTNLDAGNIATGTLDNARLSAAVTLMGNTFNGANQLVQLNGAAELPAVNAVNLINLNASNIATGTLSDARLSANVTLMGNTFNGANQLVQLTGLGYLPALNGSLVTNLNASNIATGTLSDARLSANVALLNGTQTFTGLNTFSNTVTIDTLTSVGAMSIGNNAQQLALQGDASSTWTANSGGFSTTVGFLGTPVDDLQYYFDAAATNPTSDPVYICTTLGNCAGTGGGVTTLGGTTNRLAKFTGTGSIGNSIISDTGTQVAVTAGTNNAATFRVQNSSNADILVADTVNSRVGVNQTVANYTLDVNGDINSATGLRVGGNLVCTSTGCNSSGGSGFYIQNGTATQVAANFNIESAFADQVVGVLRGASGQYADLLQAHNPSGTPVAKITANGSFDTAVGYYVNGVQISSANLTNNANLAKLNGSQTFSGVNTFAGNVLLQNAANSVGSFQIQNTAGTSNLFVADTQNTRIGIGTATPGYTLDVNGDVNISSGSAYRINGVAICGPTATCAPSSGSSAYIQNGTSLQTSANFNIQSGNTGSVVGILRGAVGQTVNLFEVQTASPSTVFAISNVGHVGIGTAPDQYDVLKVVGNSTFTNRVGIGGVVDGNSTYPLQVYGSNDYGVLVTGTNNSTLTLKADGTGGNEWSLTSTSGNSGNGVGNFLIRKGSSYTPLFLISDAGNVGIGTGATAPGAKLELQTGASGTIGQIIQGASGQSANLQEWRAYGSSTPLLKVDSSGSIGFSPGGILYATNFTQSNINFGYGNMDIQSQGSQGTTIRNYATGGTVLTVNMSSAGTSTYAGNGLLIANTGAGVAVVGSSSNYALYYASNSNNGNNTFINTNGEYFSLRTPNASANYGLFSLGENGAPGVQDANTAWDGTSANRFSGSASGTYIALYGKTSFTGNFIDAQINGTSKFKVTSGGNVTTSGSISTDQGLTAVGGASICVGNCGANIMSDSGGALTFGGSSYLNIQKSVGITGVGQDITPDLKVTTRTKSPGAGSYGDDSSVQIQGNNNTGGSGVSYTSVSSLLIDGPPTISSNSSSPIAAGLYIKSKAVGAGATSSYGALIQASTGATNNYGLVVQGSASQASDLQQWQSSTGDVLASINGSGTVFTLKGNDGNAATFTTTSGNPLVVDKANGVAISSGNVVRLVSGTQTFSNDLTATDRVMMRLLASPSAGTAVVTLGALGSAKPDTVQLAVVASNTQTYNIQEWQNSTGTRLAGVTASGDMAFSRNALIYGADVASGAGYSVTVQGSASTGFGNGGNVNIYGGFSQSGTGGNVNIDAGTYAGDDGIAPGVVNIGTSNAVAITVGRSGSNTTITGATTSVTSAGTLTLQSGSSLNIGNNAVAQTITIGNATGATAVSVLCGSGICGFGNNAIAHTTQIGSATGAAATVIQAGGGGLGLGSNGVANTIQIGNTTGAVAQTINIGNNATASSVGTLVLGSTIGASVTTLQAGTGGLNITSQGGTLAIGNNAVAQTITIGNATGATAVSVLCGTGACGFGNNAIAHTTTVGSVTGAATTTLQAGSGGLNITSTGGTLAIGNNAVAQTITIGNSTGATTVSINCGTGVCAFGNNAIAHTTTVGSVTGAAATNIQAGTGGLNIGNNAVANTLQIGNTTGAVAQTINIGNNATASSVGTLVMGSTIGASVTTIQAGTGGLNIGNNGIANTIQIGNTTGAVVQSVNIGNNATASSVTSTTIGSRIGTSPTILQAGTTGILVRSSASNSTTAFQVQNASNAGVFIVDTTTDTITVKNAVFNGTLTVNGHIISGNTTGSTTVAVNANAGTGGSASISGNDTAGVITINTGTGTTAGTQATVTFAAAYGAAPTVVITPKDIPGAGIYPQYQYSSATGTFDLKSFNALSVSGTYTFSYHVIQ